MGLIYSGFTREGSPCIIGEIFPSVSRAKEPIFCRKVCLGPGWSQTDQGTSAQAAQRRMPSPGVKQEKTDAVGLGRRLGRTCCA